MQDTTTSSRKYDYPADFQRIILAMIVRDPKFPIEYRDVISPDFFELESHSVLALLALNHIDTYRTSPSRALMEQYIQEHVTKYGARHEFAQEMLEVLYHVVQEDLTSSAEYVTSKVRDWGRMQTIKMTAYEFIDSIQSNDLSQVENAVELVRKSLTVGMGGDSNGLIVSDHLQNVKKLFSSDSIYNLDRRCLTGFESIDSRLMGGVASGEILTILGYTGDGKSIIKMNMCVPTIMAGRSFYYYTLELSAADVIVRLASRLSGVKCDDIIAGNDEYEKAVKDPHNLINKILRSNPYAVVKYLKPFKSSISHIRSHITRHMSISGVSPSLIVVDYADKLLPVSSRNIGDDYSRMGYVYGDLVELAHDFECAVVTSSQINRYGRESDLADMDTVADSFRKVTDADLVLTLNVPKHVRQVEILDKPASLFIAKSRRSASKAVIRCKINYPIMYAREVPNDEYVAAVQPSAAESGQGAPQEARSS